MTKVKLNPIIEQAHGHLGDVVFRRTRGGALSLIRKADMSNVTWSPAQLAQRERFRQAMIYARAAMAAPQVRAIYEREAASRGKRPYELAISDYFKGRNLLAAKPR